MFGSLKIAMVAILITCIAGAGMYVMKLRSDNAILKANQVKLEEAVSSQKELIAKQQEDFKEILAANQKMNELVGNLKKDLEDLDKRFNKNNRDFGKLALEKTRCKELSNLFSGPTAVALSEDAITSAKILTSFSKENENLKILGGIMGSDILDDAGVKNVATLPSLDEARAKIVGILRSPAQKIASILLAPASKIAILALEKSKK